MKPTHPRHRRMQLFFENLPHGLTYSEVAEKLREPINTATRWGEKFGYSFTDGRSQSGQRLTKETRTHYQQTLSLAAQRGWTLKQSGALLGLTRQRAHQLFGIFHIKR